MHRKTVRLTSLVADEDVRIMENELRQTTGVESVEFLPETKAVTIQWNDETSWTDLTRKLESLGYFPES
jgi:hypothetical protein